MTSVAQNPVNRIASCTELSTLVLLYNPTTSLLESCVCVVSCVHADVNDLAREYRSTEHGAFLVWHAIKISCITPANIGTSILLAGAPSRVKACWTRDHHSEIPHTPFRSAAGSGHQPHHSPAVSSRRPAALCPFRSTSGVFQEHMIHSWVDQRREHTKHARLPASSWLRVRV